MDKVLSLSESVIFADTAALFEFYLELYISNRDDSSWVSFIILHLTFW
jgi:hypothetical protein